MRKGFKTASRQVFLLNALIERSRFLTISGCSGRGKHISAWKQTLTQHRSSPSSKWPAVSSCFTSVSIALPLCLLCLLHHKVLFFLFSVKFKQLFQLFHHYLGTATEENNASSCFRSALADAHPLCHNSFFVIPRKSSQVADGMAEWKRGVQGTSLYTDGVFFFWSHCTVTLVFTPELQVKTKKLSVASLRFLRQDTIHEVYLDRWQLSKWGQNANEQLSEK